MPVDDFTPTVADVGALLRSRTLGENEDDETVELGTFTSTTRPTDTQVLSEIAQGVGKVVSRLGTSTLPEELYAGAKHAATLYTGMLVEVGYYTEQATGEDSAYARLKELFDEQMDDLVAGLPDTDSLGKGIHSIPMQSPAVAGGYPPYPLDLVP